jgi:hypothetical protein
VCAGVIDAPGHPRVEVDGLQQTEIRFTNVPARVPIGTPSPEHCQSNDEQPR